MSYEYDPNNYRIRRTSVLQNSVTEYAYDNNGSVTYQKETVGNDVTTKSYAYFDGKIIGFYINDERYYTVTDMLGTVVDVYAEDGTEVWAMDYTSFGMAGGETVQKIQLDAMFTGKDMDSETGLTYHWNRWRGEEGYNWISEDSARDGANWYGYAGQNPLICIDPDGLELNKIINAVKKTENKIKDFLKNCTYEMYADISVGGGISADVMGIGIGGDIGSEHAKFSFQGSFSDEGKLDINYDYQEYMSIGLEIPGIIVTGETPTPESARSYTSSTQEEASPGAPIENMSPNWSFGPISISQNTVTVSIDIGVQVVLGIELGFSVAIPLN